MRLDGPCRSSTNRVWSPQPTDPPGHRPPAGGHHHLSHVRRPATSERGGRARAKDSLLTATDLTPHVKVHPKDRTRQGQLGGGLLYPHGSRVQGERPRGAAGVPCERYRSRCRSGSTHRTCPGFQPEERKILHRHKSATRASRGTVREVARATQPAGDPVEPTSQRGPPRLEAGGLVGYEPLPEGFDCFFTDTLAARAMARLAKQRLRDIAEGIVCFRAEGRTQRLPRHLLPAVPRPPQSSPACVRTTSSLKSRPSLDAPGSGAGVHDEKERYSTGGTTDRTHSKRERSSRSAPCRSRTRRHWSETRGRSAWPRSSDSRTCAGILRSSPTRVTSCSSTTPRWRTARSRSSG